LSKCYLFLSGTSPLLSPPPSPPHPPTPMEFISFSLFFRPRPMPPLARLILRVFSQTSTNFSQLYIPSAISCRFHGFSLSDLLFLTNPALPSVFDCAFPAWDRTRSSFENTIFPDSSSGFFLSAINRKVPSQLKRKTRPYCPFKVKST